MRLAGGCRGSGPAPWLPATAGLALLLLASCAVARKPPPPAPKPAPKVSQVFRRGVGPLPYIRRRLPVPHPPHKPAPPSAAGATAVAALESGAPPQAGSLIGLGQTAILRLFGPASRQIEKPPARIWRYKTARCEFDLFFYLDLRSGRMKTLHYAFKGDVDDIAKRDACLRSIAAAHAG